MLRGFTPAPREQAYQQWRQQRVALRAALALWVQSTIILLPAGALSLYALRWLRGCSTLAAFCVAGPLTLVAHIPAAVHRFRPRLYMRQYDPVWAVTAALSAVFMLACLWSGVMAFMKEAGVGSLLRNMLMPAIMVYIVQPALMQHELGWQLVVSVGGYINNEVITTMASEGASISVTAHVALVALSVVISAVMEWRSRALWLRASRAAAAAAAAGLGLAGPVASAAAGTGALAKPDVKA